MLKIAIFTDTFTPQVNGVARTFQRFVNYLDERQIEYRLFAPAAEKNSSGLVNSSEKILRYPSCSFFLYPECRIALPHAVQIKKELKKFQPDLIHVATPFSMGWIGLFFSKKLNIPLVGSYHTNFEQYLEYYHLDFISPLMTKYLKTFYKPLRKIFVPSQHTKTELEHQGYSNLNIWSRGVDCRIFHPKFYNPHIREQYGIKSPYLLSYVGRLAPEKDLDLLMEIVRSLPPHINKKVHWLIVGDGPLFKAINANKPDNMTLAGYLSGQDLAEVYATSDLFVFPSSTETFGNVVLEAHASGTPVIGARADGVKEIIQPNKTGYLCEPDNVAHFVRSITALLDHPDVMKRMGLEARKYALTQGWDVIFDRLLLHYEEVVRGKEERAGAASLSL